MTKLFSYLSPTEQYRSFYADIQQFQVLSQSEVTKIVAKHSADRTAPDFIASYQDNPAPAQKADSFHRFAIFLKIFCKAAAFLTLLTAAAAGVVALVITTAYPIAIALAASSITFMILAFMLGAHVDHKNRAINFTMESQSNNEDLSADGTTSVHFGPNGGGRRIFRRELDSSGRVFLNSNLNRKIMSHSACSPTKVSAHELNFDFMDDIGNQSRRSSVASSTFMPNDDIFDPEYVYPNYMLNSSPNSPSPKINRLHHNFSEDSIFPEYDVEQTQFSISSPSSNSSEASNTSSQTPPPSLLPGTNTQQGILRNRITPNDSHHNSVSSTSSRYYSVENIVKPHLPEKFDSFDAVKKRVQASGRQNHITVLRPEDTRF